MSAPDQWDDERRGYDALWGWFGLSYASWLTLPRVLMHEMPDQWQADMARLLHDFSEAFPNTPATDTFVVLRAKGRVKAMPEWVGNYRRPDRAAIERCRPEAKP